VAEAVNWVLWILVAHGIAKWQLLLIRNAETAEAPFFPENGR
jgi:hypothetical protein